MFPILLTLFFAFALGVLFCIGFERAGGFFNTSNFAGLIAYMLSVLLLYAVSLLGVTLISSVLGTYRPPTRRLVLGAYFVGFFIAGIAYRVIGRSQR